MKKYDLLVIGGVGVDTIVNVDEMPDQYVDSKAVPPIYDYVAHTGNGVFLGSHFLGLKSKLIDFIGDDVQGQLILKRYAQLGVNFSYLVHESGTRRSVNFVDKQGKRMSFYDPRHPLKLEMPREFYLPFIEKSKHVHLSIMNWCRKLYPDMQQFGIKVSTDLHDWDGQNDYHQDFALQSDLVFLSNTRIKKNFETIMQKIIEKGRAEAVIVMAGEDGSYVLTRKEGKLFHVSLVDLGRKVVDTNGAGDSFVAAFLYGYFQGHDYLSCALLGNIAGAYAVSCSGTHEDFISREALLNYFVSGTNLRKREDKQRE